jgi:hypothetical protein
MKKNENDEDKYGHNIPYEFLIPRISFKMEQRLSYFTQDIMDLILKKMLKDSKKHSRISKIIS